MSETARNLEEREEFWRPPAVENSPMARSAVAPTDTCAACGTEFPVGARFCHVCGTARFATVARVKRQQRSVEWLRWLDIHSLRESTGLPIVSLVALIVGVGCVIAALATGFVFTATTTLDWEAVQVWRIQWLLAGVVAFLFGILLKRSP